MTIYRRVILAVMAATVLGATGLVALVATPWAPPLAWALLAGVMVAGIMALTRWVMSPLVELVQRISGQRLTANGELIETLEKTYDYLWLESSREEQQVDSMVSERMSGWVRANASLSMLFDLVMEEGDATALEQLTMQHLTLWVQDGSIAYAGLWRSDGTTTYAGEQALPDLPPELTDLTTISTQYMIQHNAQTWVVFPTGAVVSQDHAPVPEYMVVVWSGDNAPLETDLAGIAAAARYLGTRTASPATVSAPVSDPTVATSYPQYRARTCVQAAMEFADQVEDVLSHDRSDGEADKGQLADLGGALLEEIQQLTAITGSREAAPPAGLETVLQQVVSRQLARPGLTVVTDFPTTMIPLGDDPQMVALLVDALMYHAIRQTPGDGQVRVGFHMQGDELTVRVTQRPEQGTEALPGINDPQGAVVAARLAESRGGQLQVDPDSQGGTTYTATLPWGESA